MPGCGVAAGALPHLEANAAGGAAGWPRGPGSPASIPVGEEMTQHLSQARSDSGLCLLWLQMPFSSGWTIRLCGTTDFGRSRMVTSTTVRSLAVVVWCESHKSFQHAYFVWNSYKTLVMRISNFRMWFYCKVLEMSLKPIESPILLDSDHIHYNLWTVPLRQKIYIEHVLLNRTPVSMHR